MEWVETTGDTIEAAKDIALDQLGVDEQDAEFDVVEDARTGIFGRIKSPARVRARVKPQRPRPKVEGRDRRRGSGRAKGRNRGRSGTGRSGSDGAKSRGGSDRSDEQPRGGGGGRRPRSRQQGRAGADDQSATRKGRATGSDAPRAPRETEQKRDQTVTEEQTIDEQAEVAVDFLRRLAEGFGAEVDVEWEEIDDDVIEVRVNGNGLGLLVGEEGRTLFAVQELTRTVLQRAAGGGRSARLRIDIGSYREKRREALTRFVTQIAERVRDDATEQALEPMGSADRKIVHDVVNELDGVDTISEGEEPSRRVVIVPA